MAGCLGLRIDKYCVRTFDLWLLEIFSDLDAVKEDGVRITRLIVAGQEYNYATSNMQVGKGSGRH